MFSHIKSNKLCGKPPQYAPPRASWPLTFWPWRWCPNQVWRDLPYLCANFSLPGPLCSRLRSDLGDRQTDVRQTDVRRASSLINSPYPRGGGIISLARQSYCMKNALLYSMPTHSVHGLYVTTRLTGATHCPCRHCCAKPVPVVPVENIAKYWPTFASCSSPPVFYVLSATICSVRKLDWWDIRQRKKCDDIFRHYMCTRQTHDGR